MRKLLFAAGGVVLILLSLSVVAGSAATLVIHGGTLQVFQMEADIEIPFVQANVDIKPETLQIKSQGQHVMAFIELPAHYNIDDIVIETVSLGYDLDGDGVIEGGEYVLADGTRGCGDHGVLKVTFDRGQVIALVEDLVYLGDVTLTVRGQVGDSMFSGSDCIRLVD